MASAYTDADSLGLYLTGLESAAAVYDTDSSLGGVRLAAQFEGIGWKVYNPYPQLIVEHVSGVCGEGTAYIRATGSSDLKFTAPGDTEGSAVTIADGEVKVLVSGGSASKWVRVRRSGSTAFPTDVFSTGMRLELVDYKNGPLAMRHVGNGDRVAGYSTYRALMLWAQGGQDLSSLAVWLPTLGTQRTSDSAQLGGAGSGTITTTGSFADWPTAGYCRVADSGGTLKEIVYYTSRTATSLTVPAAGRALLGTSATAGAATDLVNAVPGIRIGWEAPSGSDNTIQAVAAEATAPTGITWTTGITSGTGLTLSSLLAYNRYGLWIHRQIPAGATGGADVKAGINWQFTAGGVAYTGQSREHYAIADTSIEQYELYVGQDAPPTFSGAAATTSATLPFTSAYAAPPSGTREYRAVCRWRNRYNLLSQNIYEDRRTLNSSGTEVTSPLQAPENVTLTVIAGGGVRVQADYYGSRDTSPGDTWQIYAKVGSAPTPGVDTPIEVSMSLASGGTFDLGSVDMWGVAGNYALSYDLTGYSWNDVVYVLVRSKRSASGAVSTNTSASSVTVTTVTPRVVSHKRAFAGDARQETQDSRDVNVALTVDVTNNVYFLMLAGETQLWANTTLLLRCSWPNPSNAVLHFPNAFNFVNSASALGAGTGAVEVVTGPPLLVYLVVNGTRRLKIDVTNLTVTAADFFFDDRAQTDCPVALPYKGLTTETLLQVYDPSVGRFKAFASVNSSGQFSAACAVANFRN